MSRFRGGRPRRGAPAPVALSVTCGPCGARFATPFELSAHQAGGACLTPARSVAADAVRMLSNATITLNDRLPASRRAAVMYAVQRCGLGLSVEQRARLAWLVDELADCLPVASS